MIHKRLKNEGCAGQNGALPGTKGFTFKVTASMS